MQILVLIISSYTLPIYKYNKEIWRLYMNTFPNIDSFFIEYNQELEDLYILEKDTLYFKGEESFENIIHKTLNSLEFFINNNSIKKYDFVIRSNLSTVCDFDMLQKCLSSELPTKRKNIWWSLWSIL